MSDGKWDNTVAGSPSWKMIPKTRFQGKIKSEGDHREIKVRERLLRSLIDPPEFESQWDQALLVDKNALGQRDELAAAKPPLLMEAREENAHIR